MTRDRQTLRLGVNIDHVATLRQARGTTYPEVTRAARICQQAGAHSITVHLREDRRHIQDADVRALRKGLRIPLNLEMSANPGIVAIALRVRPDEVCLVPEKREELTTEGGLDVCAQKAGLVRIAQAMKRRGIAVSLFIDPDPDQVRAAAAVGVPCVELHTGCYGEARGARARRELRRLIGAARLAHSLGLQVNAGHGLNLSNIAGLLRVPHLHTLNIGHSIVAHAVFVGLTQSVREMLRQMAAYRGESMVEECVLGAGIDLVENEHMAAVLKRWGGRFKDRVFLAAEQRYCEAKAAPVQHYAARFALKEAVSKAFGTGIGPHLNWLDVEVRRDERSGAPSVNLSPRAREWSAQRGVGRILVSLSHTRHVAVAQALLIGHSRSVGS